MIAEKRKNHIVRDERQKRVGWWADECTRRTRRYAARELMLMKEGAKRDAVTCYVPLIHHPETAPPSSVPPPGGFQPNLVMLDMARPNVARLNQTAAVTRRRLRKATPLSPQNQPSALTWSNDLPQRDIVLPSGRVEQGDECA